MRFLDMIVCTTVVSYILVHLTKLNFPHNLVLGFFCNPVTMYQIKMFDNWCMPINSTRIRLSLHRYFRLNYSLTEQIPSLILHRIQNYIQLQIIHFPVSIQHVWLGHIICFYRHFLLPRLFRTPYFFLVPGSNGISPSPTRYFTDSPTNRHHSTVKCFSRCIYI